LITILKYALQGSNDFVNWDDTFCTPTMAAVESQTMPVADIQTMAAFESQTYHEVPAQEAQYMSHTGPSQVYQVRI
jgi:hypothetical protein